MGLARLGHQGVHLVFQPYCPIAQSYKSVLLNGLHVFDTMQLCKHGLYLSKVLHGVIDAITVISRHTQQETDNVDGGIHGEQDSCSLSSVTVCPGIGLGDLLSDGVLLTYLIAPDSGSSQSVTLLLLILVCLFSLFSFHLI